MVIKWFKGIKDYFAETERIVFDGRVNLLENTTDFIKKIECIFQKDSKNKNFVIDLTNATFVYPNVLLLFIAIKESVTNDKIFELEIQEGSDVHEYLEYAGFCEKFDLDPFPNSQPKKLSQSSHVFKLEEGAQIGNYSKKACELVDFLKQSQDMSELVEAEVISSIEEILRNILQHSNCSKSYLIGQAYPTSKRIRFAFFDNGIGIKAHMTRNPYDNMHKVFKQHVSEQQYSRIKQDPANLAIVEAAKYGVSATNYQENSGAGLNFLINDLSKVSNGTVTIISEDGIVIWKEGNESPFLQAKLPFKIRGTMVSLDLNCHPEAKLVYNYEKFI